MTVHQSSQSSDSPPWLSRDDWAKGKIECSNQAIMGAAWFFAGLFAIGSWFATPAGFRLLERKDYWDGGWALLVPTITLILILTALYYTRRWRKFGATIFEIKNQTGVIGGTLSGSIRTTVDIRPQGDYKLKLVCTETIVTGSGKNKRTKTHTRWEDEKTLPASGYNSLAGLPVSFAIPADCLAIHDPKAVGTVRWELIIKAPCAGVNYGASFDVPVFRR